MPSRYENRLAFELLKQVVMTSPFFRSVAVVCCLLAGACGVGAPTNLHDAAGASHLVVSTELMEVVVQSPFSSQNDCPSLPNATATVNGVPLPEQQAGSWQDSGPLCIIDCATGCNWPTWSLFGAGLDATSTDTKFEVTDSTGTWSMTVPNLLGPRTVTRTSNAPVHVGDTVSMSWSPSTDTGIDLTAAGDAIAVDAADAGFEDWQLNLTYSAGTISFVVPAKMPPDTYTATVDFGPVPAISSCVGAPSCEVQTGGEGISPDTIQFTVIQ